MFSFLLNIYLEVKLLDYIVILSLIFLRTHLVAFLNVRTEEEQYVKGI